MIFPSGEEAHSLVEAMKQSVKVSLTLPSYGGDRSPAATGALKANSVVQVHTRPQMILPDKTSWDLRKMDSVSDI